VDVHLGPQVFANPLLTQEFFQELGAVFEVVSTNAPLPGLAVLQVRGVITGAALHAPSTACSGQGVGEGCRGHCIEEGSFLKTCTGEGLGKGRSRKGKIRSLSTSLAVLTVRELKPSTILRSIKRQNPSITCSPFLVENLNIKFEVTSVVTPQSHLVAVTDSIWRQETIHESRDGWQQPNSPGNINSICPHPHHRADRCE